MDFDQFKSLEQNKTGVEMGRWPTLDGRQPLVLAHRGASGYLPEHTLAAYDLAIDLGADYIEPDLVITKDGVLVARHDRYLSSTTDVALHAEFLSRKTEKPGHEGADWFVEDFTLAELKTLRAVQPRKDRSAHWNGKFEVPTFEEILKLAQARSLEIGRRVGVYPETKHPKALEALGLSFDDELLRLLNEYGYSGKNDPVFIQSFEDENLRRLRSRTTIKFIYLTLEDPALSMGDIATFADGVGPYKKLLINKMGEDSGFLARAHEAGLAVPPWTFRDDDVLALFNGNTREEIEFFMRLGVDGLFSDFADTPVSVRVVLQRSL